MRKLNSLVNSLANWKGITVLALLYLIFALFILPHFTLQLVNNNGELITPIDLTIGYNPLQTLGLIEEYSDKAKSFYVISALTIDIFYPIIYAFTLSVSYTLITKKTGGFIKLLPFLALCFDAIENLSIVFLLKTYPLQSVTIAHLCEIFKLLKWTTIILFILILIWYSGSIIIQRFSKQSS